MALSINSRPNLLIALPFLAPQNVPADRVAALQKAFMDMTKDAEFIAELEKMRVELTPMDGAKLQALVQEVGNLTPDLVQKIKAVYGAN